MALRLIDGTEFLHIPKTGGSWVTSVLQQNNLIAEEVGHKHADYDRNLLQDSAYTRMFGQDHIRIAAEMAVDKVKRSLSSGQVDGPEPEQAPFRFCFVRHPLAWYESWWKFMEGEGWNDWGTRNDARDWHPNAVLNGLGSSDFNQFVRNVVQARPGCVSELLYAYTKPGISFIGKTENLRSDLKYVLDHLSLRFDAATIEKSERKNVSSVSQASVVWDPQLRGEVMRLELPALLHFGYLSDDERNELGVSPSVKPHPALDRA